YVRRELFHPNYPEDFAVARFNADGSPDLDFGVGGNVTTDLESDSDVASGVAIQADGKIVAVGTVHVPSATTDFGLARYTTNGSLDTTFDGDGKLTTDIGVSDSAAAVALQGDGKIVAAGSASMSGDGEFALARYNTNGSLDTTFGGDGRVTTDFGGLDTARGIAIRGDRRLVAVGCTSCSDASDFAVARYKICRTSSRRSSIPC
ncbi:MAG TPA: hypothetical protein VGZ50_01310, partial [Actinomycetota bacterium]|nr:hypothetical protein [Actinomycetota bacterium]